jgi:iron complex outermembrane receptor protein
MKKHALAYALSLATSAAVAQPESPQEEMIVTGSRVLERLDEVPASVTVIDEEAIQQELLVSSELQNIISFRVPGMAPSTGSSSNFGQTLRGRAALVMIDGVPQSTPLRNGALDVRTIDASALERIEVIKGATSVYGNGAAGGIINYITKKPGDAELAGDVGASTRFSATKFEDSLGYRLSATAHGTSGDFSYVANGVTEDYGVERDAEGDIIGLSIYGLSDVESRNLFTKFGYQLDSQKSLSLSYIYYDAQQDSDLVDVIGNVNTGEKTYAVEAPEGYDIPGEPQGPRDNQNVVLQYADEALLSNTQMTIDAYWQEIENVFFYSTSFADPDAGYEGGNSVIMSEKSGLRANFSSTFAWSGVDATFIYGIDLLNDVTSQPLADGRSWVPEMDMTNRAAYLQSKWIIADGWVLKAGARREYVDIEVPDYTTLRTCSLTTGDCQGGNPVEGGTLDYSETTYNLGLRYNVNPLFNPFVSYSQGFDISDLGLLLRAASVPDLDQVQTEASVIDHYEVGFSGDWNALNYEFAAYRSESELGTATREFPPGSGLYVPERAPQKIWGYELALNYEVSSVLYGGVTYSWVEGEDPDAETWLDARKIAPPKFTAYLNWQPTSAIGMSANYLLVDDRNRFDPVNGVYVGAQAPVEQYDVLNVSATYEWETWLFSAGVENVLNEDYYPARAQAFTYSGYNTKGLGTTVSLGAQYRF